jgi:beta-phosphoglucomutase-like phosphatase (HAD superfamily)
MAAQFDLIVFDWDGTLMDSAARIVSSLRAAAEELELPIRSDAEFRNVIGLGLKEAIDALGYDFDAAQAARFNDRYRHHFLVACPMPEALFDGVVEILQSLEWRRARVAKGWIAPWNRRRAGVISTRPVAPTRLAPSLTRRCCARSWKSWMWRPSGH